MENEERKYVKPLNSYQEACEQKVIFDLLIDKFILTLSTQSHAI